MEANEALCTSAIVWYGFVCGPVDEAGIDSMRAVLRDRVIPFTCDHAIESARLFNACGRKRRLRVDAMIASTAIVINSDLATDNMEAFQAFTDLGLRLC